VSLTRSPVTGYASQTIGFHQPQQGATGKNTSSEQPLGLGRGSSRGGYRFASMMSCRWPKHDQLGKFSQLFDVGRDEGE
jgi:hypothetical protein